MQLITASLSTRGLPQLLPRLLLRGFVFEEVVLRGLLGPAADLETVPRGHFLLLADAVQPHLFLDVFPHEVVQRVLPRLHEADGADDDEEVFEEALRGELEEVLLVEDGNQEERRGDAAPVAVLLDVQVPRHPRLLLDVRADLLASVRGAHHALGLFGSFCPQFKIHSNGKSGHLQNIAATADRHLRPQARADPLHPHGHE